MDRKGRVFCGGRFAGTLAETPDGYRFAYDAGYLSDPAAKPVSLTLPKRPEPHLSKELFPFFYGLLAEGALKEIQCRTLKLDESDHFGRLLKTASHDTIGDVVVVGEPEA